jgi:uncharacterized protein YjeT (DUF2065 family)
MMSLIELISPSRSFLMWGKWVSNRFFPAHGLALIFIGLPLTVYKGYLSSVIFAVGLIVVFTGPFILIYPEKIRKVFNDSGNMFNDKEIRAMIYTDAFFRFATGSVFLASGWKTFL